MEYNYLMLLPVTIVIIWMSIAIADGRYRQLIDRILLILFGCIGLTCYTIIRIILLGSCDYAFVFLDNVESFVALAICPLMFIYVRMLTKDARWHKWYWWLFVPSLVIFLAGTTLSFLVGWDRILSIRQADYRPFVPAPGNLAEILYNWINVKLFNLFSEAMAISLLVMNLNYVYQYKIHEEDFFANLELSSASHIRAFIFSSILLLITMSLVTLSIGTLIDMDDRYIIFISLSFSILIYGISFHAYKIKLAQPYLNIQNSDEVQDSTRLYSDEDNPNDSEVDDATDILQIKITAWEQRQDKPYCREGLTIRMVAEELGVSQRTLSSYINQKKGVHFNRWINALRIAQAKQMLSDANIKINYVSTYCGFTDQAAFNKVFHQFEDCGPQDYRDSHP